MSNKKIIIFYPALYRIKKLFNQL